MQSTEPTVCPFRCCSRAAYPSGDCDSFYVLIGFLRKMEDSTKVVSLQIIFGAGPQDCPTRRALESTDRFIIVLTVFVPVASVARGPGKKMAPPLWPAR